MQRDNLISEAMRTLISTIFPFGPRLNIVVLFVEYDRGIVGGSDQVFAALQEYLRPVRGCCISFIRIDNKREDLRLSQDGQVFRMGGDNRYREFSGWQRGVETTDRLNLPCDLVLFVNDMFLTPGESFLKDYASRDFFKNSLSQRAIIGRIDSTGNHYTAYGYDLSHWVCTNCFLAPRAAVAAVRDLVTVRENIDDFLAESYPGKPFFKVDAPMNEAYKAWLVEWLSQRWHSRFVVEEATWDLFRAKVRNILNEALLTARFAEAGFSPQVYGERKYY